MQILPGKLEGKSGRSVREEKIKNALFWLKTFLEGLLVAGHALETVHMRLLLGICSEYSHMLHFVRISHMR